MTDLAWEYLQEDIPGVLRACLECRAWEEVEDPEAQCAACPKWKKVERFPAEFRDWMSYLLDLYSRQMAGWTIGNNDLTLDEWRVLGIIRQHYQVRQEAQLADMFRVR